MGVSKHTPLTGDHCTLVDSLYMLPHKILQHYNLQELSQMILHELGHDTNFGLKRAVYLIDNPDFDHLVGAAGFCCNDCTYHRDNVWEAPECFHHDMEKAPYHNEVKKFLEKSLKRNDINMHDDRDVKALSKILGIKNPEHFAWGMKHGNHGLLIYEPKKELDSWQRKLLSYSAALLSLCGI